MQHIKITQRLQRAATSAPLVLFTPLLITLLFEATGSLLKSHLISGCVIYHLLHFWSNFLLFLSLANLFSFFLWFRFWMLARWQYFLIEHAHRCEIVVFLFVVFLDIGAGAGAGSFIGSSKRCINVDSCPFQFIWNL